MTAALDDAVGHLVAMAERHAAQARRLRAQAEGSQYRTHLSWCAEDEEARAGIAARLALWLVSR